MAYCKTSPIRLKALLEATYPFALTLIWVWAEPFGRSHYVSNAFLALNIVLLGAIVKKDGLPTWQEAGVALNKQLHIEAVLSILPITMIGVLVIELLGYLTDSLVLKPGLLMALVIYPLWALLQDAIVFIFVLPRAEIALGRFGSVYTWVLFSVIHLPSFTLTLGSLVLIMVLTRNWRRHNSLIALAVAHGILGAVSNKTLSISMRIGKAWYGTS